MGSEMCIRDSRERERIGMLQGGESKPAFKPEKGKLVIDLNFAIKKLFVCFFVLFTGY